MIRTEILPMVPAELRDVTVCGVVDALFKTQEQNEVYDRLRIEPVQTGKLGR